MSHKKVTYLIIEDDPAFREILKVVSSKVKEAELVGISEDTLDAAKKIEREKPDILLLDVNISGLDGPEILEIADHKPKTIVISNHPKEIMDNYDVDYVEFIRKPLKNADQLINAMRRCIALLDK